MGTTVVVSEETYESLEQVVEMNQIQGTISVAKSISIIKNIVLNLSMNDSFGIFCGNVKSWN